MHEYQPISHDPKLSHHYQNYDHSPNQHNQLPVQPNYHIHPQNLKSPPNQENPELLGESQLRNINNQMHLLEKDIVENHQEIRLLNNKITKSDFQQAQLKKLFQKQQQLLQKKLELQDIIKNHQFLHQQMLQNKLKESQIRHSLGREYQNIVEQKKRIQKQQKQREKQLEANMISYNQQAIVMERQRKRQFLEQQKRQAQQELQKRQYLRELQKQQKQKQKQQYNHVLNYRNQLETQKDHVYRQYYNHFAEEQQKLQQIYKAKAMEAEAQKEKDRIESQKRNYETFQMRMARQNQEKLRKITQEKQSLRTFLQAQMEETNRRKFREKEDELKYQTQVKSYQINLNQYESMEKDKKREQQRRYDNELSSQIQTKTRLSMQGMEEGYRGSSLGQNGQMSERRTHNPVTNPIDFKIGITNPYVIKEYENTKEKYLGDNNLKLRNLAMIGNNSLMGEKR